LTPTQRTAARSAFARFFFSKNFREEKQRERLTFTPRGTAVPAFASGLPEQEIIICLYSQGRAIFWKVNI